MNALPISVQDDMVALARRIAEEAHQGQFRRDGVTPYIQHCAEVARRTAGDAVAEAAAWLHDVLEDTSVTVDDLRSQNMSEEVIEIVLLLTNRHGKANDSYLDRIASHPRAKKVKIADLIANLADNATEKQMVKCARSLLRLIG